MRKDSRLFQRNLENLKEHVNRSDDLFIQHYRNNYDEELPPAWVSCEVMSLGLLSRFYSNLRSYEVRRKIAATYLLDETFLEGYMEHLSYVRNICAHHSRLWNRHLSKKMPMPKSKPIGIKDNINTKAEHRIYNTLVLIQHLMKIISPDNTWAQKLLDLINHYDIDATKMGFPSSWYDLPIWKASLASVTHIKNTENNI